MTKETGSTTIRIRNIPSSIHLAVKIKALREGLSMEALVLKWINENLKKVNLVGHEHKK